MITKTVFTFAYQGTLRVLAAVAGFALAFGLFLVLPLLESITAQFSKLRSRLMYTRRRAR